MVVLDYIEKYKIVIIIYKYISKIIKYFYYIMIMLQYNAENCYLLNALCYIKKIRIIKFAIDNFSIT